MPSNSIRVDAGLFESARRQGELMSRSAAQQVEHWARLGCALEASGLSVAAAAELLRVGGESSTSGAHGVPENDLWAYKRAMQARDLESVRSGHTTTEQMSWFSGGRARAARLVNSPY